MFSKNLLLFLVPMTFALPVEAHARGANDQFTYSAQCIAEANKIAKAPKASKEATQISEDLMLVDNVVGIINDPKQDADFREQVMITAETMRQSLFYNLKAVAKKNKAVAAQLEKVCGLGKIKDKLHFSKEVIEDIILNMDGVDEGDGPAAAGNDPAVNESRQYAPKKEVPAVAQEREVHHELNAVGAE